MKKKQDETGQYYIFSKDKGVESLCVKLTQLLHEVSPSMSFERRLWNAAMIYLELCDDDVFIFKRKPDFSEGNSKEGDVYYWLNLCIETILNELGIKERIIHPKFNNGKDNNKGVGYYVDEQKNIYSYNILCPMVFLKSNQKDFKRIMDDLSLTFDTMSCQDHYRLLYDIKTNIKSAKKRFKSVDIITKELDIDQVKNQISEFIFSKKVKQNNVKSQNTTLSVFDDIDNILNN